MTGTEPFEAPTPAGSGSTAFFRASPAPGSVSARGQADGFGPRLAGWFDWTQAIELAAALRVAGGVGAKALACRSSAFADPGRLAQDERALARVRALLTRRVVEATTDDGELPDLASPASGRNAPDATGTARSGGAADTDFAPQQRRHAACRQAMDAPIRQLRQRLRVTMSAGSPRLARLAEVDAVMEQVIGARERAVSAATAERLAARLQALHAAPVGPPGTASPPRSPRFCQEMRALLLAELELRLQPSLGLLAACRAGLGAAVHG